MMNETMLAKMAKDPPSKAMTIKRRGTKVVSCTGASTDTPHYGGGQAGSFPFSECPVIMSQASLVKQISENVPSVPEFVNEFVNDWGFRADNYNGTGRRGNAVVRRFVQPMALGGPQA
jgi:hypothetical protein